MTLRGKVALVAGATRGAGRGIAVELGAAGATVYATGRTTRQKQSEYQRPETIEETAEMVTAAGEMSVFHCITRANAEGFVDDEMNTRVAWMDGVEELAPRGADA